MRLRFGTIAVLLAAVFDAAPSLPQVADQGTDAARNWNATIQVLVRDERGQPLAGLRADDFILTEHGARDRVLDATSLSRPASFSGTEHSSNDTGAVSLLSKSSQPLTWVLVVLAPMSATDRDAAIDELEEFLNRPQPQHWRLALLDDAGELTSFDNGPEKVRARLEYLAKHSSPQQFISGPWIGTAGRAMEELAIQPGRHAIVFASDFEYDVSGVGRNPQLMRVGPSAFIDSAVRARAAMYTVQRSGPGTVVPFGAAADDAQYFGSGQQVAQMIMDQTVSLGVARSDFLYAADQTGGQSARDMKDAFREIASDAAGYYRITFRPNLNEADGAWHPISIATRVPHARIRSAGYYLAPTAENRQQMPAAMRDALRAGASASGLDAAAHVWLFPDAGGVNTGVMAADLMWSAKEGKVDPSSKVQIFAQVVDESMGRVVGSWLSERQWNSANAASFTLHWQQEATLYPGSYSLRVVAMDSGTKRIVTRAFSFVVRSVPGKGVNRVSQVVIATRCMKDEEREGRTNLFDPLMHEGCLLAPSASASVSLRDDPTVLVRIYSADQKFGESIIRRWKAMRSWKAALAFHSQSPKQNCVDWLCPANSIS